MELSALRGWDSYAGSEGVLMRTGDGDSDGDQNRECAVLLVMMEIDGFVG